MRYIVEVSKFAPIYITYRCSRCGSIVTARHIIKETVNLGNEAYVWENNESSTYNDMIDRFRKLKRIFDESCREIYRSAEFDVKCPHCGKREYWSKMRYTRGDIVWGGFSPIVLLLFFVAIFGDSVPFGVVLMCLHISYIVIRLVHRKFIESKIKTLKKEYLPVIALSEHASYLKFAERFPQLVDAEKEVVTEDEVNLK